MKPNREIRKDGREAYSWEGTDDEDGYEDDDYWTEYDDDDYWDEYDDADDYWS